MLHFARSFNPFTGSVGSRAELEQFAGQIPASIKEELKKGTLRLADAVIYSVKHVAPTTRMFEERDDREIGMRNIAGGKLPKNQCLLLSGIRIRMWRVPKNATKDTLLSTVPLPLDYQRQILNAVVSLKAGGRAILTELPASCFGVAAVDALSATTSSYFKLDNPVLIGDEVPIEMTIEVPGFNALSALHDYYFIAALHGTITTP
jgi:hypothetical protein